MAHDHRMQEYFATANREKMRRPYPRRDRGPAAKPLAQLRRREEDAASGAKLEMARCKNKLNRAGFPEAALSQQHFLSCRAPIFFLLSLRFRRPFDLPQSWLPPEGQKTTGDSNAAVFSHHVESYYQMGLPEIVRDSSTSLGMTKMAENEPTTVSLPPSMPFLSCRAKSR